MNLNEMPNELLISDFRALVRTERKTTAEIIAYLHEISIRKLFLDMGYTSLFAFLTQEMGYSPAAAQRRIDAARVLERVPEVQSKLESGDLNLMQVALVQQACRQAKKNISREEARALLNELEGKDVQRSQVIVAKALDLPALQMEKKRLQKDESVRMELTFSKEQMEILNRFKDVVSHQLPGGSWADVLCKAAQVALETKAKAPQKNVSRKVNAQLTSTVEAAKRRPRYIAAHVRREVITRDRCCQWRDPDTGKPCGSRFQLQIDHKLSVCRGGAGDSANLQILCSVHNRLKYEREVRGVAT